uniref:Uncharacterized protein n=1 Tax=Gibberella zeae TaxID=5518 RepID=A0A4E9EA18_GIBZA
MPYEAAGSTVLSTLIAWTAWLDSAPLACTWRWSRVTQDRTRRETCAGTISYGVVSLTNGQLC